MMTPAKPTAAPAHFPYEHRTMADILAEEASERIAALRQAMAEEASDNVERRQLAGKLQRNHYLERRMS